MHLWQGAGLAGEVVGGFGTIVRDGAPFVCRLTRLEGYMIGRNPERAYPSLEAGSRMMTTLIMTLLGTMTCSLLASWMTV